MILLDTDHLTLLQQARAPGVQLKRRLDLLQPDEFGTTIVSDEEQTRGWMAYVAAAKTIAQQIDAYSRLLNQLNDYRALDVVAFDGRAATQFQRLQRLRLRIGTMDLKIASIAVSLNSTHPPFQKSRGLPKGAGVTSRGLDPLNFG